MEYITMVLGTSCIYIFYSYIRWRSSSLTTYVHKSLSMSLSWFLTNEWTIAANYWRRHVTGESVFMKNAQTKYYFLWNIEIQLSTAPSQAICSWTLKMLLNSWLNSSRRTFRRNNLADIEVAELFWAHGQVIFDANPSRRSNVWPQ